MYNIFDVKKYPIPKQITVNNTIGPIPPNGFPCLASGKNSPNKQIH